MYPCSVLQSHILFLFHCALPCLLFWAFRSHIPQLLDRAGSFLTCRLVMSCKNNIAVCYVGEDLWHAYNIIRQGDLVTATTFRKISRDSGAGTQSEKVKIKLTIQIESVEYDAEGVSCLIERSVQPVLHPSWNNKTLVCQPAHLTIACHRSRCS